MTSGRIPRRDALRRLVLLGAGACWGALSAEEGLAAVSSGTVDPRPARDRLEGIGLHLSTVRALLDDDFQGTLEAVGGIGYREVEFAGYHERRAEEVRSALQAAGLEAPAAHVSFRTMMSDWERSIVAAHIIGHRYLVVDGIPSNRRQTLDGYRRAAALFNRAAATARVAGMGFAYRNQVSDLEPMEDRIPYDLLLEETDPGLVRLELDLHRIRRGGGAPVEYVEAHPGRTHLLHLRDTTADGDPISLGEGTTDLAGILARRREGGFRHYFVADGEPDDPLASVRTDYDYLRTLEF